MTNFPSIDFKFLRIFRDFPEKYFSTRILIKHKILQDEKSILLKWQTVNLLFVVNCLF